MDFRNTEYQNHKVEQMDFQSKSIKEIFKGLNPKQVEAVECLEGPLLVMAGAGSGKTRVLTCRIANLIAHGVAPWNILAITFTNKAANEMKTRAEKMIGEAAKSTWLSTFHSFCAKILRFEISSLKDYKENFVIYSTSDSKAVIRECIRELGLDDRRFQDSQVQSRISTAKNHLLNAKSYKETILFSNDATDYDLHVANIYELYEKKLLELNAMDFDDLLMVTVQLFSTNLEVLDKYQEKFQYILVDEYQDTNTAQYKIMKLLAMKYKNVCVVGDADQSIYGWRGADMKNILSFENDYPNAKVIKLEQNYRSTKLILNAANAVIEHNINRKPKELWTQNTEGEKITIFESMSGFYEAFKIVDEIKKLKSEGFSYNDVALLYRINSQSRVLEEAFMRAGVPYIIVGGLKFYDRMEIKNILAYLRLIYNPKDNMSFKRIVNVPKRGIGTATIAKIQNFAEEHNVSVFEVISNTWMLNQVEVFQKAKQNLKKFAEIILSGMKLQSKVTVDGLIKYILEESGYIVELKTAAKMEEEERLENIGEFINVAKEFVIRNPEEATLEGFLNHISLISDLDILTENDNRVSLMTVHSAKGLEFPIVFMTGMEEGLFPHSKSMSEVDKLEEERRACYVAITRAERKLYMTYAKTRSSFGDIKKCHISRFLEEIPIDYVEVYRQVNTSTNEDMNLEFVQDFSKLNSRVKKLSKTTPKIQTKSKSFFSKISDNSKMANRFHEDWSIGDKVKHKKWGDGIITGVSGLGTKKEIEVEFLDKSIGTKTLSLIYAPITKEFK